MKITSSRRLGGMGDWLTDALAFNTPPDQSIAPSAATPPPVDTSSSFNIDNVFSALSTLATKVAVPIYVANQAAQTQQQQLDYNLKVAQLKAQNPYGSPIGVYPTRTGIYTQGGAQPSNLMPILLLGAAALAAVFILKK